MSYMILGGLGFLGQNLCRLLSGGNEELIVYSRKSEHALETENLLIQENVMHQVIWGDFENENEWEKKLKNVTLVFHLISTTKPSNLDILYDISSNVEASVRLFEVCAKLKIKVIFFSSGGTVYGIPRCLPIDELHQTNPISTYGISKLFIEKCLMYYGYSKNLDYVILRIANPYGKGQNLKSQQGFIGIALAKSMSGKNIEIWGDGNIVRDYIYMDDLLDAVRLIISYKGNYKIFNVGYGKGYSINEIVSIIQKYVKPRVSVEYKAGRAQDVPANILSHELLYDEIGWIPKVSIEEGIKRLIYSWNPDKGSFI